MITFGTTDVYDEWDSIVETVVGWCEMATQYMNFNRYEYGVGIMVCDVENDETVLAVIDNIVAFDYPNRIDILSE